MAKGLELQYYISDIRRTEYCSQASSVHVIHFSTCTHTHVCTHAHTHTYTHTQHTHAPTYLPLSPYQAPCPWAFARLFPPPDTLIQPSIFLPLIKCYSFLRAHCKCCFFQDVFPDPSQGGHISPYLSHSSTIFGFTKRAFYHRYLCQELSLAPS